MKTNKINVLFQYKWNSNDDSWIQIFTR